MKKLTRVNKIIIHTAAYDGKVYPKEIDEWHRARGWSKIGYHFVVNNSGIFYGRELLYQGAHAKFNNKTSIGICVSGNGDNENWMLGTASVAKKQNVIRIVNSLRMLFNVDIKNVIGHREIWASKVLQKKTCPGKLIDMKQLRKLLINSPITNVFPIVVNGNLGDKLNDRA